MAVGNARKFLVLKPLKCVKLAQLKTGNTLRCSFPVLLFVTIATGLLTVLHILSFYTYGGGRNNFFCNHVYTVQAIPPVLHYCPPAINVFFLKTHKCASSTLQNILMRFGEKRNLSFALPEESNYFGHPEVFTRFMLSPEMIPASGFNIFCHHTRFNRNEVQVVLPTDAVFVTILRDPVALFQSLYSYYELHTHTDRLLRHFLKDSSAMSYLADNRLYGKIGRNQMLFDLGYEEMWDNRTLIQLAIEEVDETFDILLIAEYFDESLILLKERLCWNMEDVVYFVHNRRNELDSEITSKSLKNKIRQYNMADQMLYDYFKEKLLRAIQDFGEERMAKEVEDLRTWNKVWYNHCIETTNVQKEDVPVDLRAFSDQVYSFVLRKTGVVSMCHRMVLTELHYTDLLRKKQLLFASKK